MSLRRRTSMAASIAAVTVGATLLPGTGNATTPTYFPAGYGLDTTAYTLRFAGSTRFTTAGSIALVAAENQANPGFPFNNPNATNPASSYGLGACPSSIVVAASDGLPDALAASSMKDLAALQVDDEVVNTAGAVLLLTDSGRSGADDLSTATVTGIRRIADVCGDDLDAVVLGGTSAVPNGAVDTLDDLLGDVVRIAGADRFDTARRIAAAVFNTSGLPEVPLHTAYDTPPTTVNNAVFLAEALTGADALAVGPYASFKNAPILLTGSAALAAPTASALAAMAPETIIVLGGPGAISDAVANAAAQAAGRQPTAVRRIAGANRYDTSVQLAQQLRGLYPPAGGDLPPPLGSSPPADLYSNQTFALARSEGADRTHAGWPDALASAYFLDSLDDAGAAPRRLAPPVELNPGTQTIGGTAVAPGTPLLLVAQATMPPEVQSYLSSLYPSPTETAPPQDPPNENDGGFGYVFGGASAISATVENAAAEALSGGAYVQEMRSDQAPTLARDNVFFTGIDYTGYTSSAAGGVDQEGTFNGVDKVCALRNALVGVQHLAVYNTADGSFGGAGQVDYQDGGTSWEANKSRMFCVPASSVSDMEGTVLGFSLSGNVAPGGDIDWSDEASRLSTLAPGGATAPSSASTEDPTADLTYPLPIPIPGTEPAPVSGTYVWNGTMGVTHRGTTYPDASFTLTWTFTRTDVGDTEDALTFTGSLVIREASSTLFSADIAGESSSLNSPLKLAGRYKLAARNGGIKFTVTGTGATASLSDLVVDGLA